MRIQSLLCFKNVQMNHGRGYYFTERFESGVNVFTIVCLSRESAHFWVCPICFQKIFHTSAHDKYRNLKKGGVATTLWVGHCFRGVIVVIDWNVLLNLSSIIDNENTSLSELRNRMIIVTGYCKSLIFEKLSVQ